MREAPGVYNFGTKRINVKIEQNKLKVRVGGGWLSIEEFTEQHLPIELDKVVLIHRYEQPTYDGQGLNSFNSTKKIDQKRDSIAERNYSPSKL